MCEGDLIFWNDIYGNKVDLKGIVILNVLKFGFNFFSLDKIKISLIRY